VDLKAFKHFMSMLDMVLVDDSGNLLGLEDAHRAVDMDALDDDDDETDEK
jgi:hypothetical protein